jgi:hypothetical protein
MIVNFPSAGVHRILCQHLDGRRLLPLVPGQVRLHHLHHLQHVQFTHWNILVRNEKNRRRQKMIKRLF